MKPSTHLVIRFSAMGDVLLTLPVLVAAGEQNPHVEFVVLTRPKFAVFFEGYSFIKVISADVDKDFKGLYGLWRLSRLIRSAYAIDYILDLHQHLRTRFLKLFFVDKKAFTLDKGRAAKKALVRKENKLRTQLPHATERYAEVLRKAGLKVDLGQKSGQNYFKNLPPVPLEKSKKWVGIAPFAQHKGKIWPIGKIKELIQEIPKEYEILLFGGGQKETEILSTLTQLFPHCTLIAGKYSLKEELAIISKLEVMLCMDSSNMHMAALSGIPTVSIWGATHIAAGFGPFGSQPHQIVEVSPAELPCRPCSIFGQKPCYIGDYPCLHKLPASSALQAINQLAK